MSAILWGQNLLWIFKPFFLTHHNLLGSVTSCTSHSFVLLVAKHRKTDCLLVFNIKIIKTNHLLKSLIHSPSYMLWLPGWKTLNNICSNNAYFSDYMESRPPTHVIRNHLEDVLLLNFIVHDKKTSQELRMLSRSLSVY